jgi:hypothetical protein
VLISNGLVAGDAERTRMLLALWTEPLKEGVSAAEGPANPFAPEARGLPLAGDFLDSQPANFVFRDGRLHRLDVEWEAEGPIDFDLTCVRGLFHFAVDVFTRGIAARRVDGSDVGSFVMSLAEAAGVEGRARALERLPAAEGELQALVRGWRSERGRAEIERILRSAPDELTVQAGVASALGTHHQRAELEAELDQLRRAHEAQARHLISERLVIAGEIEREVGQLREEIAWRKGVMEHKEEAIEHHRGVIEEIQSSRSIRYTAPLRRMAGLLRR